MPVISLDERPLEVALHQSGTVALGFFDGCHLGHQQILDLCREKGLTRGGGAVLTFGEHPGAAIPGRQAPQLITTTAERIDLLRQRGLKVFLKRFDREFSTWSPERFVGEVLARQLGVDNVVVGHDYRFGHRASGDVERLVQLGGEHGFGVTVVPAVTLISQGEPLVISSTKIRQAVAEGELELAERLLGRPFSVAAVVKEGQKKGRTISFPTANMSYPEDKVMPPYGVMVVRATTEAGQTVGGVANFGLRPTVEQGATEPLLEAHLFDFEGELYDQRLRVDMLKFLRPERKFASFAALRDQILADAAQARDFLRI